MNSYHTPADYYGSQPKLGIPASLVSDDLLAFKGARARIRQIPASSGSNVGPSSSILFQIPQESSSFMVPNSCYLRGKCVVTQTGAANVLWTWAGRHGQNLAAGSNAGNGGASSLFRQFTVTLPGGSSMSYNAANHWRNAILPHALSQSYLTQDMRQMEHAGVVRVNGDGAGEESRTCYFAVPVDIPIFNSAQAVPLLLMSGGITLEIVTATAIEAFSAATQPVTNFSLSELSLCYECLEVPPEYKQALMAASIERPFSLSVRDRVYLGSIGLSGSTRVNIGLGLSSLRAIVGTFTVNSDWAASTDSKVYKNNGMTEFHIYVNGQEMTLPIISNDAVCYAELQRALGNFNDALITSSLRQETNAADGAVRNNFCSSQFAFATSTEALADAEFSLCGVPADQIALEVVCGTVSASAWQNTTAPAAAQLHLWGLYDSVVSVDGAGVCMVRK